MSNFPFQIIFHHFKNLVINHGNDTVTLTEPESFVPFFELTDIAVDSFNLCQIASILFIALHLYFIESSSFVNLIFCGNGMISTNRFDVYAIHLNLIYF